MEKPEGMQYVEDDLAEEYVEDWAKAGVAEIEAYLEKHAKFGLFLLENETDQT